MNETNSLGTELLGAVRWTYWALLVVTTVAASLLLENREVMAGIITGGLVGLLNFEGLRWLGSRILDAPARSRTFYAMLFLAKMTLVFGAVWWFLSRLPIDSLGFLVGFSLLLPAIGIIGLRHALAPAAMNHGGMG